MKENNGIGIIGMLGVAFVVLKLIGFIDWSWWYVTMPFWLGIAIVAGCALIYIVVRFLHLGITELTAKLKKRA